MTKKQMIERLARFDDDTQIMILDGFNGGGDPRSINLSPIEHVITEREANNGNDCEEIGAGTRVAVIGYGCY